MQTKLPSTEDVRDALAQLTTAQIRLLEELSEVSRHTLLKIRSGETSSVKLDTARLVVPHIKKAARGKL